MLAGVDLCGYFLREPNMLLSKADPTVMQFALVQHTVVSAAE